MSRKEFFLLIFLFQRADAKCDNERCPPMEGAQASIFSCGVVISGTGENTKCGYLIKPRDKFPVQEERCKSTKIVKRRKADYVISYNLCPIGKTLLCYLKFIFRHGDQGTRNQENQNWRLGVHKFSE